MVLGLARRAPVGVAESPAFINDPGGTARKPLDRRQALKPEESMIGAPSGTIMTAMALTRRPASIDLACTGARTSLPSVRRGPRGRRSAHATRRA